MFKRNASLILCAVIILGLASACNAGDDDPVVPYNDPVVPSIEITPAEYGQTEPSAPTPTPTGEIEEPAVSIVSVPAPPDERPLATHYGVVVRDNPDGVSEYIKIEHSNAWGYCVTIVSVSRFADSEWFTYDDFVFGFGRTSLDIYYGTTIPVKEDYKFPDGSNMPDKEFYEAIIFSDHSGHYTKSFILRHDEDGNFEAIEVKINGLPRFPYIRDFRYLYDRPGTIPIKLFSYDEVNSTHYGDEENFRYMTVYIPEENFLEEAAKLMYLQELFSVNSLWYEGSRLYADMNVTELRWASNSSMGSAVWRMTLLMTLASFPDVSEVVVLFEGEDNVFIDGFPYNGVFTVSGSLWADIDFKWNEE
jgi:hypothetical protein